MLCSALVRCNKTTTMRVQQELDSAPDFKHALTGIVENYSTERQLASTQEQEIIKKLKRLLGDNLSKGRHSKYPEVVGDIALLRYVRGARGDLKKAEQVFRNHLVTRKDFCMDDMRDKAAVVMEQNNYTFRQEDLLWGTLVGAYLPTVFDAGLSIQGDPVCDMWFVSGRLAACIEKHGAMRVMQYTVNWFIFRQIQLDHYSRLQGG